MRSALALIAVLACGSPRPPSAPPAAEQPGGTGFVEGHVRDAKTGAGLIGVDILVGGPCRHGDEVAWAVTDEHGRYRVELGPGSCDVSATFEDATAERNGVVVRSGSSTVIDLELSHSAVAAAMRERTPLGCPGDPRLRILHGHTTPQADLDDVARAVLTRFTSSPTTIPDAGLLPVGPVFVKAELAGERRQLGPRALPTRTKRRLVARPGAELQALADRSGREVFFIELGSIYTNGACAIVSAGVDFVTPNQPGRAKLCCCSSQAVYAKRGGRWWFVRRLGLACA